MDASYNQSVEQVFQSLSSGLSGLTPEAADALLIHHGRNELPEAAGKSIFRIAVSQFAGIMNALLFGAAAVSIAIHETMDGVVVLTIILVNAVIGFVQEAKADGAVKRLRQLSSLQSRVLRAGVIQMVESALLVPGDLILLEAGNIVPADARLIEAFDFRTSEAALTGESLPVRKTAAALIGNDLLPADQLNMVFKGTAVVAGSAKALVTGTGMNTEIGKIAGMLSGKSPSTPLQAQLNRFARQLSIAVVCICAGIFGLGLLRGEPVVQLLITAVSMAVAALPEALPVVVTASLAIGATRMAKHNALVRSLSAVESLGAVSWICCDKTGTLTLNQMRVEQVQCAPGMDAIVSLAMMLNHDAHRDAQGVWLGDPMEVALIKHGLSAGMSWEETIRLWPRTQVLPFDSDRMMMTTIHDGSDGYLILTKGAPNKVVERTTNLSEDEAADWISRNDELAAQGYRVLAVASRQTDQLNAAPDMESGLSFAGLIAVIDPPRSEVKDAIRICHEAGIRVLMITGDQAPTARFIASRLGIISSERQQVISGAELQAMDEVELHDRLPDVRVFARVTPDQKLRIVSALQQAGALVAMTGDGVNDAPALKKADIGVAMGITGTDVSKEVARLILLDDNFSTIPKAIREGRRIYDNIRKFIQYILSCNLGELLTVLVAPMAGMPLPLLPIQILWINLVTDGLPGIALSTQRAEQNIMQRLPRDRKDSFLRSGRLTLKVVITGVLMGGTALIVQAIATHLNLSAAEQQTMVFTFLCLAQLLNAMSIRNGTRWAFEELLNNKPLLAANVVTLVLQAALLYVPLLNDIFHTAPLEPAMLAIVFVAATGLLAVLEVIKMVIVRRESSLTVTTS